VSDGSLFPALPLSFADRSTYPFAAPAGSSREALPSCRGSRLDGVTLEPGEADLRRWIRMNRGAGIR
jgi:hypothetical protein